MIVDASALTAILLGETDAAMFLERLTTARSAATHPVSILEATQAVARVKLSTLAEAREDVYEFIEKADMTVVSLGSSEAEAAIEAAERYGRGRHAAKLNMGDCFSYACAKLRGVPLLYKGDDFALTDLA